MSKLVLIVDDDELSASTKALVIEKLGEKEFSSEVINGGQACLDRLSKAPTPDLILLDLNMPEVSGADVIRKVLSFNPVPKFKILPMTAWGEDWLKHWNLTDLSQTETYKEIVFAETYDKASDPHSLLEKMRKATT